MIPKRSLFQLAAALEGVAVVGVLPGTPAEGAGIRYGDVLLEVNGMRVRNFDDYIAAKALRDNGMDVVVFRSGNERIERLVYEPRTSPPDIHELVAKLAAGRLGVLSDERPDGDDKPS
jgi:S1-C subfamily serine protease